MRSQRGKRGIVVPQYHETSSERETGMMLVANDIAQPSRGSIEY